MEDSQPIFRAFTFYQSQADMQVKNYLLSDPLIPYTSLIGGILASKLVYDLSKLISTFSCRSYHGLTKTQTLDWNNRSVSTLHAMFISTVSLYFVFWSYLFSESNFDGHITLRSSSFSTSALGISVGYFAADLGIICWMYPSLGGVEYIIHHSLSGTAVAYAMFTGEGQLYTFMVLISEATTPAINLRWYLDTAGLKKSNVYLINGITIFVAWLVARIILFIYVFYHVYRHRAQVLEMHTFGIFLVVCVPFVLSVMNLMWFGKIIKGLKKTLAKQGCIDQ